MTVVPRQVEQRERVELRVASCASGTKAPGRHDNSAGADFARGSAPERHHNSAGADFARGFEVANPCRT